MAPPYTSPGSWVILTQLTFFQHNAWSGNTYNGPSTFYAWNQGNGDNPVSWANWTGKVSAGNQCGSAADHQSGYCTGPFGQDSASTYHSAPVSAVPSPPAAPSPAAPLTRPESAARCITAGR